MVDFMYTKNRLEYEALRTVVEEADEYTKNEMVYSLEMLGVAVLNSNYSQQFKNDAMDYICESFKDIIRIQAEKQ